MTRCSTNAPVEQASPIDVMAASKRSKPENHLSDPEDDFRQSLPVAAKPRVTQGRRDSQRVALPDEKLALPGPHSHRRRGLWSWVSNFSWLLKGRKKGVVVRNTTQEAEDNMYPAALGSSQDLEHGWEILQNSPADPESSLITEGEYEAISTKEIDTAQQPDINKISHQRLLIGGESQTQDEDLTDHKEPVNTDMSLDEGLGIHHPVSVESRATRDVHLVSRESPRTSQPGMALRRPESSSENQIELTTIPVSRTSCVSGTENTIEIHVDNEASKDAPGSTQTSVAKSVSTPPKKHENNNSEQECQSPLDQNPVPWAAKSETTDSNGYVSYESHTPSPFEEYSIICRKLVLVSGAGYQFQGIDDTVDVPVKELLDDVEGNAVQVTRKRQHDLEPYRTLSPSLESGLTITPESLLDHEIPSRSLAHMIDYWMLPMFSRSWLHFCRFLFWKSDWAPVLDSVVTAIGYVNLGSLVLANWFTDANTAVPSGTPGSGEHSLPITMPPDKPRSLRPDIPLSASGTTRNISYIYQDPFVADSNEGSEGEEGIPLSRHYNASQDPSPIMAPLRLVEDNYIFSHDSVPEIQPSVGSCPGRLEMTRLSESDHIQGPTRQSGYSVC